MRINKGGNKMYNKGITMIVLVITIIILIILAGVSLNLTIGENGMFQQAKQAKENMQLAKIEEEEQLNRTYGEMIAQIGPGEKEELENKLNSIKKEYNDFKNDIKAILIQKEIPVGEEASNEEIINSLKTLSLERGYVQPYLYAMSCGDNRQLNFEFQFDVQGYATLYIESYRNVGALTVNFYGIKEDGTTTKLTTSIPKKENPLQVESYKTIKMEGVCAGNSTFSQIYIYNVTVN